MVRPAPHVMGSENQLLLVVSEKFKVGHKQFHYSFCKLILKQISKYPSHLFICGAHNLYTHRSCSQLYNLAFPQSLFQESFSRAWWIESVTVVLFLLNLTRALQSLYWWSPNCDVMNDRGKYFGWSIFMSLLYMSVVVSSQNSGQINGLRGFGSLTERRKWQLEQSRSQFCTPTDLLKNSLFASDSRLVVFPSTFVYFQLNYSPTTSMKKSQQGWKSQLTYETWL